MPCRTRTILDSVSCRDGRSRGRRILASSEQSRPTQSNARLGRVAAIGSVRAEERYPDAGPLHRARAPGKIGVAVLLPFRAGVAKLADARDSKSRSGHPECGFDSLLRHHRSPSVRSVPHEGFRHSAIGAPAPRPSGAIPSSGTIAHPRFARCRTRASGTRPSALPRLGLRARFPPPAPRTPSKPWDSRPDWFDERRRSALTLGSRRTTHRATPERRAACRALFRVADSPPATSW